MIISNDTIEKLYNGVVNALLSASNLCIKRIPSKSLKFWWNSELNELKMKSMTSHRLWIDAGKPKTGCIFERKNKEKYAYKIAIKEARDNNNKSISDELHTALASEKSASFWKTWKNKVCKARKGNALIEGNLSSSVVVEEFAKLFKEATLPNSATFDTNKNNEFSDKIKTYIGHSLSQDYLCNAELVAMALMKMEKGKSPGVDKLTVEHFNHCHPVIFTLLANLFNVMLCNSFVLLRNSQQCLLL